MGRAVATFRELSRASAEVPGVEATTGTRGRDGEPTGSRAQTGETRSVPLRGSRRLTPWLALVPLLASACATSMIPNTDVEDTEENREVIRLCEQYRRAVERRNVREILSLASPDYYEDSGTPSGDDDYDLAGLRAQLLRWRDSITAVRYEVRYRRVTFERSRALVEYTYTASFRVRVPDVIAVSQATGPIDPGLGEHAERWQRRVADNRLELERRGGQWRILSGM